MMGRQLSFWLLLAVILGISAVSLAALVWLMLLGVVLDVPGFLVRNPALWDAASQVAIAVFVFSLVLITLALQGLIGKTGRISDLRQYLQQLAHRPDDALSIVLPTLRSQIHVLRIKRGVSLRCTCHDATLQEAVTAWASSRGVQAERLPGDTQSVRLTLRDSAAAIATAIENLMRVALHISPDDRLRFRWRGGAGVTTSGG